MTRFLPRRIVLAMALSACPVSLWAAAPPQKDKKTTDKYVRLAPVALPLVFDGRVVNYVFITVHVHLTPKADLMKVTAQEPVLRDALIRAAHNHSFATRDNRDRIDEALFKPVMLKEFSRLTGPDMVKAIEIVMQTPKRKALR